MTDQPVKFLSCHLIVVDDIDAMALFFRVVFETPIHTVVNHPCKYALLSLSSESTLIIVQRRGCDDGMIASFGNIAVRHLFLSVNDANKVQMRATQAGAQVLESDCDKKEGTMCVLEAPEGLVITIVTHEVNKNQSQFEIIMNAMCPKGEEDVDSDDGDDFSRATPNSATNKLITPRPIIHTLDVSLFTTTNQRGWTPAPPNNRKPIAFETELFKGVALLVVRTNPIDPHYRQMIDSKVTFEVQVQGKFKRIPRGEVYVGADVSNKLELGLITRSFCRAILSFASTMVQDLHYSLGDDPSVPNYEIPHLVGPLFKSMDRVIITPPTQEPPILGVRLYEDLEARRLRMKTKLTNDWKYDTSSTYTFSVNTFNLDLCSWQVVGIPMLKPMDLRTFIGDSNLRLVGYEMPSNVMAECPEKHPQKKLNYVFNLRISQVNPGEGGTPILEPEELSDDEAEGEAEVEVDADNDGDEPAHDLDLPDDREDGEDNELEVDADGDGDVEVEPGAENVEARRTWKSRLTNLRSRRRPSGDEADIRDSNPNRLSKWFRRSAPATVSLSSAAPSVVSDTTAASVSSNRVSAVPESYEKATEQEMIDFENILRSRCPACLEAWDPKQEQRRQLLFVLPVHDIPLIDAHVSMGTVAPVRLRTYSEIIRTIPSDIACLPIPRCPANSRFSQKELRRRHVAVIYEALLKHSSSSSLTGQSSPANPNLPPNPPTTSSKESSGSPGSSPLMRQNSKTKTILSSLLAHVNDADRHIMSNSMQRKTGLGLGRASLERWEGNVAMATSRGHWTEEFMSLTIKDVIFRSSQRDATKKIMKLELSTILRVTAMTIDEIPFEGFWFFNIETFPRVYHLMVRQERHLQEWMQVFSSLLGTRITQPPNLKGQPVPIVPELEKAYVVRLSGFNLLKHRVLNCRRMIFNKNSIPSHLSAMTLCQLVEHLLEKIFAISAVGAAADAAQWVEFMEDLCILQVCHVPHSLSLNEKVSLLLNLYHLLVLHGFLVIGPPPSWVSWPAFFFTVSYKIGCNILSISEIEYHVRRTTMNRPVQSLTKNRGALTFPVFPELLLQKQDFRFAVFHQLLIIDYLPYLLYRLHFCLNCGARSMPMFVPIYRPSSLDRQLDDVTMQFLAENVRVDVQRRVIILPKVCSWFLQDFAARKPAPAVPADCVRVLASYLRGEARVSLLRMLTDGINPSVRFRNFNFRCRPFAMYVENGSKLE